MKTTVAFVVLACVALSVSGCGSSPQDLIIGKWEAGQAGSKLTAEFGKDGKAKLTIFGKTLQGTYKVSGDELEWTVGGKTTKFKMKVTATELEVTSEGNTITYKKV
jgi:uncharacterized protein (TIGR03066 family)